MPNFTLKDSFLSTALFVYSSLHLSKIIDIMLAMIPID